MEGSHLDAHIAPHRIAHTHLTAVTALTGTPILQPPARPFSSVAASCACLRERVDRTSNNAVAKERQQR